MTKESKKAEELVAKSRELEPELTSTEGSIADLNAKKAAADQAVEAVLQTIMVRDTNTHPLSLSRLTLCVSCVTPRPRGDVRSCAILHAAGAFRGLGDQYCAHPDLRCVNAGDPSV